MSTDGQELAAQPQSSNEAVADVSHMAVKPLLDIVKKPPLFIWNGLLDTIGYLLHGPKSPTFNEGADLWESKLSILSTATTAGLLAAGFNLKSAIGSGKDPIQFIQTVGQNSFPYLVGAAVAGFVFSWIAALWRVSITRENVAGAFVMLWVPWLVATPAVVAASFDKVGPLLVYLTALLIPAVNFGKGVAMLAGAPAWRAHCAVWTAITLAISIFLVIH